MQASKGQEAGDRAEKRVRMERIAYFRIGSTYGSGVAASGNTDYGNYDNLYYADANTSAITAPAGNSIIVGANDGATLSGVASMNTVFYENASVGSSIADTLNSGAGRATESVDLTHYTNITVLDLRTGTDSLSSGTYNANSYIIDTFGTSTVTANAMEEAPLLEVPERLEDSLSTFPFNLFLSSLGAMMRL